MKLHFIFSRVFWLCSLFFIAGLHASAQEKANVLKGDLRVHDPVMIKQGDTYYIFSTGKGIPIKTSKDRITWKNSGVVFNNPLPSWYKTDIPEQDGSLWAPDIHYRDGKFHLYYSVSAWMNFNSSIGYATNTTLNSADPDYKWVDEGQVISVKNGGKGVNVIDPNIVVQKNGKVWLLYGSYKAGLRLVELDQKTGKLKSENPELITITPSLGEGSYIIKGPKYYYIFASRGICCKGIQSTYQVVMGRAKNIKGPYLNKQGESWLDNKYTVFLEGNYEEPGRGHNGFFTENDTTFIVYHAYTRAADGASLLNIKPVYVDADGWPSVAEGPKLFKLDDQKHMQVVKEK
jgi:arabinan endo-1,5-alpha-L-arabinosidase